MVNRIEPHELFLLEAGTAKVSFEKDTKMPNAGTFKVEKEDHTLGNVLRYELLRNPSVLFAGYKMPHPLEHRIVVKVRWREGERETKKNRGGDKRIGKERER